MTQKMRVLEYMQINGSITQAEADTIKVKRLASRIYDLRKDGRTIIETTVKGKNEYGSYRCSRYSLGV